MAFDVKLDVKVICAKCRSALDTKDVSYCRQYDEGFTGVAINPQPCEFCTRTAIEKGYERGLKDGYEKAKSEKKSPRKRKDLMLGPLELPPLKEG